MAISRAQLLEELLPALNEIFGTEYEKDRTTWAVFADYDLEHTEWKIAKIEQWDSAKHSGSMQSIHKITDQIDEVGAYKAFMQAKEQTGWKF